MYIKTNMSNARHHPSPSLRETDLVAMLSIESKRTNPHTRKVSTVRLTQSLIGFNLANS